MPSVCLQCFDAVGWVAGRGMTKYRKGPQRTAKEHYTGPQRIGNHERTARLATILFNFLKIILFIFCNQCISLHCVTVERNMASSCPRTWTGSRWHTHARTHTHTRLTALCPGLPGWAGTRKVKPIWILLKQETVSGSGISWAVCKSAPRSRQITMPAPHHSVFTGRMLFLPPNQQRQSTEGMWVEMTVTGNLTPDNLQFLSWRKAEQQDSA